VQTPSKPVAFADNWWRREYILFLRGASVWSKETNHARSFYPPNERWHRICRIKARSWSVGSCKKKISVGRPVGTVFAHMPDLNEIPLFRCPGCFALCQASKAEAGPETVDLKIACQSGTRRSPRATGEAIGMDRTHLNR
jgi:hypothetical protein